MATLKLETIINNKLPKTKIMKIFIKTLTIVILTITSVSCSKDTKNLSKDIVLKLLKQQEIDQPIVFKNRMSTYFIKSKEDLNKSEGYYSRLYNEGYIEALLRKDIPNPETSNRPFKVVLTKKAKPYILETIKDGAVNISTLQFNAIAIKEIRMLSEFKAEVDVEYKKTKSPFHKPSQKDISGSGKEYPNDTYIKTLEFRKNKNTNEWKNPIKIVF